MAYADYTYYSETYGGTESEDIITPKLEQASDDIDALTFSRINAITWGKLTDFQQALIQKACCVQADFLSENADAIDSALTSYAINGVSMEFGNPSLYGMVDGVVVANRAMALLRRTGLTSRIAYRFEVDREIP